MEIILLFQTILGVELWNKQGPRKYDKIWVLVISQCFRCNSFGEASILYCPNVPIKTKIFPPVDKSGHIIFL